MSVCVYGFCEFWSVHITLTDRFINFIIAFNCMIIW